MVASVTEIHPWVVHFSLPEDEFAAKCGASYPGMLVVEKKPERWLLFGYKICEKCQKVTDLRPQ